MSKDKNFDLQEFLQNYVPSGDLNSQALAWRAIFALCVSLGMEIGNKKGVQAVHDFICDNVKF